MAVIGEKGLEEGVQIGGAHIDSPRLDLKPLPLYEDSELAYFKTHYYGGIRKYQWVAVPLELHGVAALKNGETVEVRIGCGKDEPRLVIERSAAASGCRTEQEATGRGNPGGNAEYSGGQSAASGRRKGCSEAQCSGAAA